MLSLALVVGFADPARSLVEEIEEGGVATFRWATASGPVDHYEVQIATEETAPFSWEVYGVTGTAEPEIAIPIGSRSGVLPLSSNLADLATLVSLEFDENSGMTVSDSTGNGHTGTISGAAWVAGGWDKNCGWSRRKEGTKRKGYM